MGHELPGPVLPIDGSSPCQIFLDRMEDIGLQIDQLLQTLADVDAAYQKCATEQEIVSATVSTRRKVFENAKRLAAALKTTMTTDQRQLETPE